MNFFLDTNILYKDPFLLNNFNRQLLDLVKTNIELQISDEELIDILADEDVQDLFEVEPKFLDEEFRIYISSVVYQEAKKYYIKKIKGLFRQLKDINKTIAWYMNSQKEAKFPFTEEQCIERFDQYYQGLIDSEIVTIIEPPNEITEELIRRAIQEKEPFFNNGKNEFRDAVIWLTYATYAEQNSLDNCYFITDNVKDFSRKSDRDQTPIPLHPELRKDSNRFMMYRSVQDLFTHDDEFKKRIEVYNTIKYHRNDMELFFKLRNFKDKINNNFVLDLLNKNEYNQLADIEAAIDRYVIERMDVDSVIDVNDMGYLQPNNSWIEIDSVDIHDKEIVDDAVLVSATISLQYTVSVFLYNPVYDSKDEKYEYIGDKEINFIVPISFMVNLDNEIFNFECDNPWVG
ncbi:PIN domain-containing protein [Geobacillus stearothermophilus]|uniref:PIN domain-containing protein n=1 Tax=Geobacillus stearothermophilus TaxID=1422 RepID=UPI003D23AB2D